MTGPLRRVGTAVLAACLGLGLAACTNDRLAGVNPPAPTGDGAGQAEALQLVAFDSCDVALASLRKAAKTAVGPYGLPGGYGMWRGGMERSMDGAVPQAAGAAAMPDAAGTNFSGTNNHEAGVDEPDLVKTDGHRIVTIASGVLRVVDVASRTVVGDLDLSDPNDPYQRKLSGTADLLLAGGRALVLFPDMYLSPLQGGPALDDRVSRPMLVGARLVLVDLNGSPRVISSYRVDGSLVDARQVGTTVRVVVRSQPTMQFPWRENLTDAKRIAANKKIIDGAGLDSWLPHFETTTGGQTESGRVPCDAVTRPDTYTGTNMLTVLTFGLDADSLGGGDPLTLLADGDTVYSNGPSLYVASDQRWRVLWAPIPGAGTVRPRTAIYRFDTSAPGRPRFVAGGSVPGYLINQYAMSEWDGKLRVATTTGQPWQPGAGRQESAVYVLAPSGRTLRQVGHVGGLGKGEQIYAVRFVGTVGYVVTFRQTDPLYTLDLADPAHPAVRGALKIAGYSAYLHPAGDGRLIGVGQDASEQGSARGTQISLFDVADLTDPQRLARYKMAGAYSEAEFDPHAFLYWPRDGLLVIPLQVYTDTSMPADDALVLRVNGSSFTKLGSVSHPRKLATGIAGTVRRSLVIDQTLWTVSDAGLMANDTHTLVKQAWLPFT